MLAAEGSTGLAGAIGLALVNVVPAAGVACVVAVNRRRLLRPEWGIGRTVGLHAGVGVAYAVVVAALATAAARLSGHYPGALGEDSPATSIAYGTVNAAFLYMIFFGFLVWSESILRVQESRRVAAHEAVLRAEAEAKAVRAQFNPHFVFNTLHSLMLLVRADPTAAERAIEDVATLIRYASVVQRRDLDGVPLAKELEVARRYLALEQLRLQDRLEATWRVDVDPSACTIPAFSLQTLVENAIKHGLEPKWEGGRLSVEITGTPDEGLVVRVADDGVGADASAIVSSEGRGLALLGARLDAAYGERGGLEWRTAPGDGFEVELRLPFEAPEASPALDVIEERPSDPAPAAP